MPRPSDTAAPKPRKPRPGDTPEPLRRRHPVAARNWDGGRRLLQAGLVFVTIVLLVDALIGEKGLVETMRARRQSRDVAAALETLRRDNARLREEVRRLNEDPNTIEALARQDLGLIRPGEMLFIIKDVRPSKTR